MHVFNCTATLYIIVMTLLIAGNHRENSTEYRVHSLLARASTLLCVEAAVVSISITGEYCAGEFALLGARVTLTTEGSGGEAEGSETYVSRLHRLEYRTQPYLF